METSQNDPYPLHTAIKNSGFSFLINLVLTLSVNKLNEINEDGKTPIHIACEKSDDNLFCLNVLLTWAYDKIDINKTDKNGDTPMHFLIKNKKIFALKQIFIFFVNKIDFSKRDRNGKTILELCCENESYMPLCLALAENLKLDKSMLKFIDILVKNKDFNTLKLLIECSTQDYIEIGTDHIYNFLFDMQEENVLSAFIKQLNIKDVLKEMNIPRTLQSELNNIGGELETAFREYPMHVKLLMV
jgi:ankyrin repeat protein